MQTPPFSLDAHIRPFAEWFFAVVFWPLSLGGVEVPLVVLLLFLISIFCTIYLGFPLVRFFPRALRIVLGREDRDGRTGEVSHFQALATALSGTVGIGNIANVAVAISIGGPGVTFWMILAGLLGTSVKLVECTLGVQYRASHPDGSVSGGPMYYLRRGLADLDRATAGKILGAFYAMGLLFGCMGSGNMFQSNQAFMQVLHITGGPESSWLQGKGWLFGLVMAALVGAVILGGIKSIARVTSKLVPFMAILYLGIALTVIVLNAHALPFAIESIIVGAFQPNGVVGGGIGVAIMGVQRAVFSNESGVGTASIAHSAVRTDEPASEGLVSLLEPFIDTVIICTITAMVIITTSYDHPEILGGFSGIELTSTAFSKKLSFGPAIVSLAAVLFAFSTIIAWAYYGLKGWTYIFGHATWSTRTFKFVYCGATVLGCSITLRSVLLISDAMMFLIVMPNLVALLLLSPKVKAEIKRFQENRPLP